MKSPQDRWLDLLLWTVIVFVAWKMFVALTVRPEPLAPGEKSVPINPRQLSPTETQPK